MLTNIVRNMCILDTILHCIECVGNYDKLVFIEYILHIIT